MVRRDLRASVAPRVMSVRKGHRETRVREVRLVSVVRLGLRASRAQTDPVGLQDSRDPQASRASLARWGLKARTVPGVLRVTLAMMVPTDRRVLLERRGRGVTTLRLGARRDLLATLDLVARRALRAHPESRETRDSRVLRDRTGPRASLERGETADLTERGATGSCPRTGPSPRSSTPAVCVAETRASARTPATERRRMRWAIPIT
mmetsp:Transcript_36596/g.86043  ORF Transcript_36596/g.86043 Transcript_36596/m.86043 type:complete len:207 (-) Transcript_36596:1994-2614(-)